MMTLGLLGSVGFEDFGLGYRCLIEFTEVPGYIGYKSLTKLTEVPGMVARAYRTHRSSRQL